MQLFWLLYWLQITNTMQDPSPQNILALHYDTSFSVANRQLSISNVWEKLSVFITVALSNLSPLPSLISVLTWRGVCVCFIGVVLIPFCLWHCKKASDRRNSCFENEWDDGVDWERPLFNIWIVVPMMIWSVFAVELHTECGALVPSASYLTCICHLSQSLQYKTFGRLGAGMVKLISITA